MPDTVSPAIDIDHLRSHIGNTVEDRDTITAWPMAAMNATLDRQEADPQPGTEIPQGWHQFWFLPTTRPGELGPDGAPTSSGVIPAMPLPRRMFAGTTWAFHQPLRIGDECRRETELTDIQRKSGSTGALVFATVVSRIYGPNGLAIEEERGTAFREAVAEGSSSAAPKRETPPADTVWKREHSLDEAALFRFSALTFNTHRIHYDTPWAKDVEGYPALVVHGQFDPADQLRPRHEPRQDDQNLPHARPRAAVRQHADHPGGQADRCWLRLLEPDAGGHHRHAGERYVWLTLG